MSGPKINIEAIIGAEINNDIMNERTIPGLWIILIRFKSINIEKNTNGIIIPGSGPRSSNSPLIASKNIGRQMRKIKPNWIKKLIATHFIFLFDWALVITKSSFKRKISPISKAAKIPRILTPFTLRANIISIIFSSIRGLILKI